MKKWTFLQVGGSSEPTEPPLGIGLITTSDMYVYL